MKYREFINGFQLIQINVTAWKFYITDNIPDYSNLFDSDSEWFWFMLTGESRKNSECDYYGVSIPEIIILSSHVN